MKKKVLVLIGCAIALCLSLVACGGGGGGNAEDNFVGTWKLSAIDDGSESVSEEDMAMFEEMGISQTLTFNADKTVIFDVGEEALEGTWEAVDASKATMTINGETAEITIADGKLSLSSEGMTMIFVKGEAKAKSSGGSDDSKKEESSDSEKEKSSDSDAADTLATLADDDVCTILVTEKKLDWSDDPGYGLKITNHTDRAIYVSYDYGTFSVDGKMVDPWFGETIQPGKYVEAVLSFDNEKVGGGLDALVNVEGVITVDDDETYDELASYTVNLP